MIPEDVAQLARALAPEVARLLVLDLLSALPDPLAEVLEKRFRRHARALVDTTKANSEALVKSLGAMEVREQEGAVRKQAMVDTADDIGADIRGLSERIDSALKMLALTHAPAADHPEPPRPEPPKPTRTSRALDRLGAQWIIGIGKGPATLVGTIRNAIEGVVTFARSHPVIAIAVMSAAGPGLLRILAAWIPGAAPFAELLQAIMDQIAPLVASQEGTP